MAPTFHKPPYDDPPTEGVITSRIENALDDALDELGLPEDVNSGSVKREKYIFLTVEKFAREDEEPLTMSWFKWGIKTLSGPGGQDTGRAQYVDRSDADGILNTSVSKMSSYLQSDEHGLPLDEWWNKGLLDFVERFYIYHSTDEYRPIYLSNVRILRQLNDIDDALYNGDTPLSEEAYYDLCDAVGDLKGGIASVDHLSSNYNYIRETGNLVEDTAMMLVGVDSGADSDAYQTAIEQLTAVYRENTWKLLANSMSAASVVGPNASYVREGASATHQELESEFPSAIQECKRICRAADLTPSIEDYSRFERQDDEFEEKFDEFMQVVDGQAD